MSDDRTCPECGHRMVFSGDGHHLVCEQCGSQRQVEQRKKGSIEELIQLRRMMSASRITDRTLRPILRQAIGLFHDGKLPIARSYFEQVILKTGDHEEEMEAWLWLSKIVHDPAEKRLCLEAVLAIQPTDGEARRELALLDGRLDPALLPSPATGGEQPSEPPITQPQQMSCPQCSGAMRFDPEQQHMVCPFCQHVEMVPESIDPRQDEQFGQGALEQDFDAAIYSIKAEATPQEVRVFNCQGCGSEFILTPTILSLTCPYCSSVYVTEAAETIELIPPQGVIPFGLTRDDAKLAAVRWFKERNIARHELTRVSSMSGYYIPVWTFDIGGEVKWHGTLSRPDRRSGRAASVPVFNSKYLYFNDYLVLAMPHQNELFTELITGYDLDQIIPYDPKILADWPAERYSISVSDAANQARSTITRDLRRLPHGLDGGDQLDEKTIRCDTRGIIIESYKLLLLPVWSLHYLRSGRSFDLLINGQTGEVEGLDDRGLVAKLKRWFSK